MLVIVADKLPDRVRGVLKLWCLEPKPNVFVSDISKRIENHVIDFLQKQVTVKNNMIIMRDNKNNIQGFDLYSIGDTKRSLVTKTGLVFIKEKDYNI